MRSFIIKPGDLIPIGRAGENQATQIRFDVTGWAEAFGAGTYTLVVKRPHEDTAYPVEVTTDGDYVVWTVSNVDTGIAGNASVQLRYVVDGALAKSVIYTGIVGESLDNIVDPPDPFEDLIQRMVDLAERTEAAAESAAGSAASASESAETATAAKTAAQTAAQAAQTAQGTATQAAQTATQAKDAAQAAQQAAEAAKAAAAQSATAASGSATAAAGSATQAAASATAADASATAAAASAAAAQAAAMDVIDKAPIITDTASGAIASFPDGSAAPIKQLTVAVNPVQDLHGYDAPWPAGGRGNIFDGQVAIGGISTSNGANIEQTDRQRSVNYIPVTEGQAYYFYRSTAVAHLLYYYDSSKAFKSYVHMGTENGSFTVPTGAAYVRFVIRTTDMTANVAVNYPNSITTYSPYSNICPITGWTGAEVTRAEINICDEQFESGGISTTTGQNVSVDNNIRSKYYNPCVGGTTYYIKGAGETKYIYWYDSGKNFISYRARTSDFTMDAPDNAYYFRLRFAGYGTTYNNDASVNYPSTDTDYHQSHVATYPITWQSEAGTVYGGTVTVNQDGTGTLRVDRAEVVFDQNTPSSDITFQERPDGVSRNRVAWIPFNTVGKVATNEFYSNVLTAATSFTSIPREWKVSNTASVARCFIGVPLSIASRDDFLAYCASNPIHLIYPLATPVTYTLSEELTAEITTLLGQNNVWADTGDVSVTYRADTKLYIDKKLAALVAALS